MTRLAIIPALLIVASCSSGRLQDKNMEPEEKTVLSTNQEGKGPEITIEFSKGKSFYYPLFAIWLEDADSNYIQTLYVAKSVATGVFRYGIKENNKWQPGARRAPQTLPYWSHKRGIKAADGLYMPDAGTNVTDAYTGATPVKGFVLTARADSALPEKFRIMLEINQNWDWNEYWTNDKFPDDENYKMSCQPAVIYEAFIDSRDLKESYEMKAVGHSHYSGKSGALFTDLSTLTTALEIAGRVVIRIRLQN